MKIKELLFSKDKNDVAVGLSLLGIENEFGTNWGESLVFINNIKKHQDLQLQKIFTPMNIRPTMIQKNRYINIKDTEYINTYHISY